MGQVIEGFSQIDCNCAHYLVIINGFFPLDHFHMRGLADSFEPEAWQKLGQKHIELRKH